MKSSANRSRGIWVIIVVLFLQSMTFLPVAGANSVQKVPTGIMSFGYGPNFLDTKSLDLDYISGMTAYFAWNDLEPEDNNYDFGKVNKLITLAKQKGGILNIGFYAGANSPKWIYRKGAKSFSWYRKLNEDQAKSMGTNMVPKTSPLPWDDVYIEYWKRFISKFAEQYKNEPVIGYISIVGPQIDETTTGILLSDDKDWKRFVESGYSYDKLLKTWLGVIDHYEKVMPYKRFVLTLGLNKQGSNDISRSKDLVDYIIRNNYTNISFLCVFLNDTFFLTSSGPLKIRALLRETKARGYAFGYQMAQSAQRNATWVKNRPMVKSLKDSLSIGIADGASWLEVWHDDIIDPAHRKEGTPNEKYIEDLKWAHDALMKNR